MKTHLPDKLSDIIEVALDDLQKIEKDDRYKVCMSAWHGISGGICLVCLAGAVMARVINNPSLSYVADSFDDFSKLSALDSARLGRIGEALQCLDRILPNNMPHMVEVTPYNIDRDAFYQDMTNIVNRLRKHGL